MDFAADHAESLSTRVYVVQSRFDGTNVSAEFLVDSVIALGDCLVGILDEATAQAGTPGAGESAALAPGVQALSIEGELRLVRVALW